MAFLSVKNVSIKGFSVCVPENVVENKDYSVIPEEDRERFIKTIGVERRHCVEKGTCTSDLCYKAAENLIEKLGWDKQDIELLVFVSQTPDYKMPSTSCVLQNRLKLPTECLAFDISMGCSGFVYGLGVVGSLLSSGPLKKALLMVGNTQSLNTNFEDQSAYPLFGDAGSVTALEYDPDHSDRMDLYFATDGSGEHTIIIPDGGYRNPISEKSYELELSEGGIKRTRLNLKMVGEDVFSFVISQLPKAMNKLFDYYDVNPEDLDYLLLHHASKFLCEKLRKKMKFPEEKVPYNLKDFGNSSNASIPLLLVTNLREEVLRKKLNLLITGFGVGLSLGCGIISLDKIECADFLTM